VDREVGRGGMGVVLRGRDLRLGRALAFKVLRRELRGQPAVEQRFVREAQVCSQLQHPGIVPVYEASYLANGLPYFTMKLVQGLTLARLLKQRAGPGEDLDRWLGVFVQVCQAVALAHSKGVLHRDLKPGNVMVGEFGEVQVMDWGMAKVRDLAAEHLAADPEAETVERPVDLERPAEATRTGMQMGTPAYMAPEQARGEVGRLDARCDVFGLGAILCEILTGAPPYRGPRTVVEKLALRADLGEALSRLEGSGADPELVGLARQCLAADPGDRPADAGAVAQAVSAYRSGVQERLRRAELERAAAEAQAREERKRRRVQLALAAAVVLLVAGGAAAGLWFQADRVRRTTELDLRREYLNKQVGNALREAGHKRAELHAKLKDGQQVQELLSDIDQWRARVEGAKAAWQRADLLVKKEQDLLDADLARQLRELAEGLAADEKDWALAKDLDDIHLEGSTLVEGKWDPLRAAKHYPEVFARVGLDVEADDPADVSARIVRAPARWALVAALDHWAQVSRDDRLRARLLQLARQADPHPWRDRFRDVQVWDNLKALERLAKDLRPEEQSPQVIGALAHCLRAQGGNPAEVLRRALLHHGRDFWLFFNLASYSKNPIERVGCLQAALVLRPQSSPTYTNLGLALDDRKDYEGAITACRMAIQHNPKFARHYAYLAAALLAKKDVEGAIGACRKAIQLDPEDAWAYGNLGNALRAKQDVDGAINAYRTAIKLAPNLAIAYSNLSNALRDKEDLEGAIRACRRAIQLDPNLVSAHQNLGVALEKKKDLEGAIRAYRRAIQLDPNYANGHLSLGNVRRDKQDLDGAISAFRTAIQLDPNLANAHYALGHVLRRKDDLDGAISAYRRAIQVDPNYAEAHCNLGLAYRDRGNFAEALQELERGHARGSQKANWRYPSAQWIQTCQHLLSLERRLAAFLDSGEVPPGVEERLALVDLCRRYKHYACAVRLSAGLFASRPALADDLAKGYRYQAAGSAVLAAAGKGRDPKPPDAAEKTKLRAQALEWLRAELDLFAQQFLARQAEGIVLLLERLPGWEKDEALASVRRPYGQAGLTVPEETAWNKLWLDRDQLLQNVRAALTETRQVGTLTAEERAQSHERELAAGTTYVIDLHSTAFDAYLKLLDPRGKVLAEHDDIAPDNQDARLVFTPKEAGTFRIVATSFEQRGTGPYTLTIRAIGGKGE
jgi:tetratricopeptide (TPR) repeat protein/tRNA A-37 threonylcarbamoyl transferase component Bud32